MTDMAMRYIRRPFYVTAIQVTTENMEKVADWCGGTIYTGKDVPLFYIKVPVIRPVSEKQTNAKVGDWILSSPKGFKVYNDLAFRKGFEPAVVAEGRTYEETLDNIEEALIRLEEKLSSI